MMEREEKTNGPGQSPWEILLEELEMEVKEIKKGSQESTGVLQAK